MYNVVSLRLNREIVMIWALQYLCYMSNIICTEIGNWLYNFKAWYGNQFLHWISKCNGLTSCHDDVDPRITHHRNCHIISQLSLYKCHHDIMSPYHHVTKSWSHHLWHWISLCSCAGVKNQLTHDTSLYPASSHYCMLRLWLAHWHFSVWIWSSWLKKYHPK